MRGGGTYPLVVLVILDGWGCAPAGPGNAVSLARTPVFDRLWNEFPHTTLKASGEAVGLPPGQMGNSEVGHLTIGSGRILFQDLMRVNKAIETGALFENEVLRSAFERGENVHLLGLVSHGGVHSHIEHVKALMTFAPEKTWIHAFTDGRDVSPHRRCTISPSCRSTASPPSRAATTRWTATSAGTARSRALDAIVNGEGEQRDRSDRSGAGELRPRRHRRVHRAGRHRWPAAARPRARHGDLLQLPARPHAAAVGEARRARRRPDDDDALPRGLRLPRRLPRAEGRGGPRRGARASTASASCTPPRRRSTPTSRTSSTAGASRSSPARRGSSSRRRATSRATTRSRRCRRSS